MKTNDDMPARELHRDAGGAVIVESAIVLALLLFLAMSAFDFFMLSGMYIHTSQVAREGVMTGTTLGTTFDLNGSTCSGSPTLHNGMEQNLHSSGVFSGYSNCRLDTIDSTCGHNLIQWRVQRALEAHASSRFQESGVTTRCMVVGAGLREIEVEINMTYFGISPVFGAVPLTIRQRGKVQA